ETGAGQHGVATATVAALLGQECEVYMGAEDVERQALNVFRMRLLGARVIPVETGSRTLKDAVNEALRDWVTNVRTTYYVLGSAMGPHPYPMMVRDFHTVIGKEARAQARRARARVLPRQWPLRVHVDHRRRSARRLPDPRAHGRDHARARIVARDRVRGAARQTAAALEDDRRRALGPG